MNRCRFNCQVKNTATVNCHSHIYKCENDSWYAVIYLTVFGSCLTAIWQLFGSSIINS